MSSGSISHMALRWKLICAAMALAAGVAVGQQEPPTTAPASDAITPRGALHALNHAMREGEVAAIKRLFLASNEAERKMVEADAQMAAALADLRRAASRKFGEAGAELMTGDSPASSAVSSQRIEAADIAITGDTATVVYRDEKESPFVLKRVAGQWKVPVSELAKPMDRATLEQRLADLDSQCQVVREITRQIDQGRFTAAEQAKEAWRARIFQAAASQPTTRPAGRPPSDG